VFKGLIKRLNIATEWLLRPQYIWGVKGTIPNMETSWGLF